MPNLKRALITCLSVFCLEVLAQATADQEGFEVVRQDEKITMYERWAPFPGTTINSRQIKCVFQTSTNLSNMLAHIYEDGKIQSWQKNILEYKITPRTDSTWIAYSHYRIPWPLTNQDYLLQYSVVEKNEKRIILSFEHVVDDKLQAAREGIDRKPTVGRWELEKQANGKVKVTYIITTLPVNFPRMITDKIVHNNIMNTINTLIVVAEK
jgi:hypothetical protein